MATQDPPGVLLPDTLVDGLSLSLCQRAHACERAVITSADLADLSVTHPIGDQNLKGSAIQGSPCFQGSPRFHAHALEERLCASHYNTSLLSKTP